MKEGGGMRSEQKGGEGFKGMTIECLRNIATCRFWHSSGFYKCAVHLTFFANNGHIVFLGVQVFTWSHYPDAIVERPAEHRG